MLIEGKKEIRLFTYSAVAVLFILGLLLNTSVLYASSPQVTPLQQINLQPPVVNVGQVQINGFNVTIGGNAQATSGAALSEIDWNWGDGTTSSGSFPQTHFYASQRTYQVSITGRDSQGNFGTAALSLNVFPYAAGSQLLSLPPEIAVDTPKLTDGSTVFVNGFYSSQSSASTVIAVTWNWGDGNTTVGGFPQSHTYSGNGNHIITVSVQDSNGNLNQVRVTASTSINSVSTPSTTPLVSVAPPIITGRSVALTGTIKATAPGASIDWKRSNIDWNDGAVTSFANFSHTYSKYQSYTIKLNVYDTQNNQNIVNVPINIVPPATGGSNSPSNLAPYITVSAKINGLFVTLSGNAYPNSQVSGASIVQLSIDWNDGNVTNAYQQYNHTYASAGTYYIKLIAVDSFGNRNSVTDTVTVLPNVNLPTYPGGSVTPVQPTNPGSSCSSFPTLSLNQPTITGPLTVRIGGQLGSSVTGGTISWGDQTNSSLSQYTHTYPRPGPYTIVVAVHNSCGNAVSQQAFIDLSMSTVSTAPSISGLSTKVSGYTVTLSGSITATAPGASIDWSKTTINWGGLSTTTTANYNYTFPRFSHNYTIQVTATDTFGNKNTAIAYVSVPQNLASTSTGSASNQSIVSRSSPPLIFLNGASVNGLRAILSGTAQATAPGASINWNTATINWGDGTTTPSSQYIHNYSSSGIYIASLTVRDTFGNMGSGSTTIHINAQPPTTTVPRNGTTSHSNNGTSSSRPNCDGVVVICT